MIPVLLIAVPLLSGLLLFAVRQAGTARTLALVSSLATFAIMLAGLALSPERSLSFSGQWLTLLGSSFSVSLDGMGKVLCLLTALAFPIIFGATWHSQYKSANRFFALMLLAQAGLMGVFLAMDALLFYFFWELALVPVYFLCSQWGGERRIAVTFKFFVYTFLGSVLMLIGIIYLQSQVPNHSFALADFYNIKLDYKTQEWVFWLFFIAFAIKMPIFPFHSWQPDTYEQSPTATTMVLSGLMVKMGLLGVIRWLLPVVPIGFYQNGDTVSTLALIGILYASLLAWRQDDIKRLVAYSSMAHMGLMCMAVFAENTSGLQGVMIQMFNHGINIIGLWIVVELVERSTGTRKLSGMGGIAQMSPALAIMLVVIAFANIALPLTNAFVGEWMMFNGIFSTTASKYAIWFAALALIAIILAAVYTLRMVQKVLYGETSVATANMTDIRFSEKLVLSVVLIVIIVVGVFPQPVLDLTKDLVNDLLKQSDISSLMIRK